MEKTSIIPDSVISYILELAKEHEVAIDVDKLKANGNFVDARFLHHICNRCAWWTLKPNQGPQRKLTDYYRNLIRKHERKAIDRAIMIVNRNKTRC